MLERRGRKDAGPSLRVENGVIRLSARLFLGTTHDDELRHQLEHPIDWSLLLQNALKEGMAGLVGAELQRMQKRYGLGLPLGPFSAELRNTFSHNGTQLAALPTLRDILREWGTRAVLLKGGALLETEYRGRMGLRPLSDLDILVKSGDLPAIRDDLVARGFRSPTPASSFFSNGRVAIDLHSDLLGASRIHRRALAVRFDEETLWRTAVPLGGGDDPLLVLSPALQFLHLATHALKHSFSRLIWLVDMGLVARHQDWEALARAAKDTGSVRPLSYAIRLLDSVMGLKTPADLGIELQGLNPIERVFLGMVEDRQQAAQPLGEMLLAFSIPKRLLRLAYFFEFTFPSRKVLSNDSPATPAFMLYPRRLTQIFSRGLRFLGGALSRS